MREAVGIVARVGITGQLKRPVGELEAKGVPALGAPALADPPALQDHVLAPMTPEHRAHRDAGLAAPDDHRVMVLSHALLRTRLRVEPSVPPRGHCRDASSSLLAERASQRPDARLLSWNENRRLLAGARLLLAPGGLGSPPPQAQDSPAGTAASRLELGRARLPTDRGSSRWRACQPSADRSPAETGRLARAAALPTALTTCGGGSRANAGVRENKSGLHGADLSTPAAACRVSLGPSRLSRPAWNAPEAVDT